MNLKGWVNVDLNGGDVHADIRNLPFADNSADAILLCHVIEHFTYQDAKQVLGEAFRVLRPGGEMVVEGPDVNKIIEYCHHEGVEKMSRHLYGIIPNDGTMADCHKSGWTADIVEKMAHSGRVKCDGENERNVAQPSVERLSGGGRKMKICVCGWYFNPEFMRQLELVHKKYPVVVVSHRNRPIRLPHVYIPNVGLEWGAYNYYLKYIYDGKGKVLFTHDDNDVEDVSVFDELAKCDLDVGFVFRNSEEAEWAQGCHGRAIVMSEKFLNFCKNGKHLIKLTTGEKYIQEGFWYDKKNFGYINNDDGIDCNDAISRFNAFLQCLSKDGKENFNFGKFLSSKIKLGFRGGEGIADISKSIRALKKPYLDWSDIPDRIRL